MRRNRALGSVVCLLLGATAYARVAAAQATQPAPEKPKPRITILATGGTIAGAGSAGGYGYQAGSF